MDCRDVVSEMVFSRKYFLAQAQLPWLFFIILGPRIEAMHIQLTIFKYILGGYAGSKPFFMFQVFYLVRPFFRAFRVRARTALTYQLYCKWLERDHL